MADRDEELGLEIADDEPCGRCGYNLRGLREGHRCPECGTPIPFSFPPDADDDPFQPLRKIAGTHELEPEAVLFVMNALTFAAERASRAGRRGKQFSAEEFGWCLRDYALERFGTHASARERLGAWRIGRSEDVGAVLVGFVEAGLLKGHATDPPSAVEGAFDLETLFG